jgi:hypothetical protein
MQMTLSEIVTFLGILISIATGIWVILDRFGKLEGRVGRLEEKVDEILIHLRKIDEILVYLSPKFKRKKIKHLHRKH